MNLRYEKRGLAFVPQHDVNGKWQDFKFENVSNSTLERVCIALGNIGYPRRYSDGMFYIEDKKREDYGSLVFASEMLVMAFLGAAKFWFTGKHVDFKN